MDTAGNDNVPHLEDLGEKRYSLVAPVSLQMPDGKDSVSHSLAILTKVYHYNHWIFDSLRDHIGPTVMEVGAGVGNITQFLLNHDSVACLEPFAQYHKYLSARMAVHSNVHVYPYKIEDCPNGKIPEGSFHTVLCLNVLEHIRDDVEALRRMRRLVRPGGNVIILVPALQSIYGRIDKAMGHYRRYSLSALRKTFQAAGLKPKTGRYMNSIGVGAWWWFGCVLKRARIDEKATVSFDRIVPLLAAVEKLFPPILGQSVYMIGEAC